MMDGNRMCGADDKNSCILYICCSKSRFRYAVNLKTKISRLLLVEHKEFEKCRIGVLGTSLPSVSKSSDQRAPNIAGIFQALSDVTSLEYRKTFAEKSFARVKFMQVLFISPGSASATSPTTHLPGSSTLRAVDTARPSLNIFESWEG